MKRTEVSTSSRMAATLRFLLAGALAAAGLGACQVDNDAALQIAAIPGFDASAPTFAGVQSLSDVGPTSLVVLWNAADDHGGTAPSLLRYRVYMATTSGAQNLSSDGDHSLVGATEKRVGGLTQGTTYCIVVRAEDAAGNRDGNTQESCTVTPTDSTAPVFAGLGTATLTQPSPPQITLGWAAALDDGSPASAIAYDIFRAEAPAALTYVAPLASVTGATIYVDAGIVNNRVYYYGVRARDESGNGELNAVQRVAGTPFDSTGLTFAYYPGLQPGGLMGTALALLDWDGDGRLDLAVGASDTGHPAAGFAAYQAGQVSIFLGLVAGGFSPDPAIQFYSPNPVAVGRFGTGLAACDLRADGTADDLVVGASGEARAYLYLAGAGGQDATPDRTIDAPVSQGDTDNFGESIACGHFNGTGGQDLVIAAPLGDTGGTNTGRLFFYNNNSSGVLIDIDGPAASYFISPAPLFVAGTQPACGRGLLAADFDGDGIADLAVGCPDGDPGGGGNNDGIAGFLRKPAANDTNDWAAAGAIPAPNTNNRWGTALAAGNFDDTQPGLELAVGQPGFDSPGIEAGAVHLYSVSYSAPDFALAGPLRTITNRGANGDFTDFGAALAAADVSGTAVADLVVGAPAEDLEFGLLNNAANVGALYHFAGALGTLLDDLPEQADFHTLQDSQDRDVPGGTRDLYFAYGGCTGDIDNDGRDDVLIGAQYDPTDGVNTGRLYVWYSVPSGEIDFGTAPGAVLHAPGLVVNKNFGTSCLVMDANADGLNDLLVGAEFADDNATNQGAVYVYLGQPSPSTGGGDTGSIATGSAPNDVIFAPVDTAAANHFFGKSLAACDLTGDGFPELIVGARSFDSAQTNALNTRGSTDEGAVFLFGGTAAGIDKLQYQGIFPTDQPNGLFLYGQPAYSNNGFGYAVACFASVNGSPGLDLVVGAYTAAKTGGSGDQGMVAVFRGAVNEDPAAYCLTNDYVGSACLIEDSRDVRIDDQGPFANDDSLFGSALAVGDWNGADGLDLVVGAGRARVTGAAPNNNGGVYAFRGGASGGFLDLLGGVPLAAYAYGDPTGYANNRFGDGVLALSDVNNNGVPELLIGAWACSYDDPGPGRRGTSTGCVFIDRGDYRP